MADMFNASTFAMNAGSAPVSIGIPDGVCTVTITSIQRYVGFAQYGSGSWTPVAVASMSNSGYLGGVLATGESIKFKARSVQSPSSQFYVASLEATNPSIASVTIVPE